MTIIPTPTNSDETPTACPAKTCACGPWWRLPLLLGLVLAAILLMKDRTVREETTDRSGPTAADQAGPAAAESVSITIDFGDGRKQLTNTIPWHVGMTVRALMSSVSLASFGEKGSGASAFLTEIEGLKNEGAGGRNWMYSVNGQRGDRSFAVYELQPGDHVLWSFAPPQ